MAGCPPEATRRAVDERRRRLHETNAELLAVGARENPFVLHGAAATPIDRPVASTISAAAKATLRNLSTAAHHPSPQRSPRNPKAGRDASQQRQQHTAGGGGVGSSSSRNKKRGSSVKGTGCATGHGTMRSRSPRSGKNSAGSGGKASRENSPTRGGGGAASSRGSKTHATGDPVIGIGRTYFAGAYHVAAAPLELDRELTRLHAEIVCHNDPDQLRRERQQAMLSPANVAVLERAERANERRSMATAAAAAAGDSSVLANNNTKS